MEVLLRPEDLNYFRSTSKEPQWVTIKLPNRANILLDSRDYKKDQQTSLVSLFASTANDPGEYPSILATGITKLSVTSFSIYNVTPNVNIRNNNIQFFSSVSASTHSVIVPEQFYVTTNDLITAIVAALNTVTGASGLTFSFAAITGFTDKFDLNSAGGDYYILNTCNAITKGYSLWNLPPEQVLSNSKEVGNMRLLYTTYIDVCSQELTKYTKLRTTSTNQVNNIVVRMNYSEPPNKPVLIFLNAATSPPVQYYRKPNEPITTVDIQIRDMFGDLLYVPYNGTFEGFYWTMGILIET